MFTSFLSPENAERDKVIGKYHWNYCFFLLFLLQLYLETSEFLCLQRIPSGIQSGTGLHVMSSASPLLL